MGRFVTGHRRNRLAILKSFFRWAADERGLDANPAERIKPPKRASVERQAYAPDVIDALWAAQPTLPDQIAIHLLGKLARRRGELGLLKVEDFDIKHGTVRVHGKGGKVVVLPLGFKSLKRDLEVYLVGREATEYLLHPRHDRMRPMDPATIHRWFKPCLRRAGLPETMKVGTPLRTISGVAPANLAMAQQLLRHESPATTARYLHPTRDDLEAALQSLDD